MPTGLSAERLRIGSGKLQFASPLIEAKLINRYKRFLADVELSDGSQLTVHCPNTGSMKNCAEPGSRVWLSDSNDPKRKYRYSWQLVETAPGHIACIHSALANKLVKEALVEHRVPELADYDEIKTEVRYGQEKSRIDLLLEKSEQQCFVEIKSVTLAVGEGLGLFPDAVSARGTKHLRELMQTKKDGARAVLFFCVQHTGITGVAPADEIDSLYSETLREAVTSGVEVLVYGTNISPLGVELAERLIFDSSYR